MKHLHERMDEIFSKGNPWPHRTLRTLFDPYSSEWAETTMEKKVSIIRKIQEAGENLEIIALEYKQFYTKELNKPDVAKDFDKGLIQILEYLLLHRP